MAKKESINLIEIFSDFKDLKNIDRQTFIDVMEDSFRNVLAKMFGTDENYDVIVNPEKGDFEIYRNRTIVEDDQLTNENTQIRFSEAKQIDSECEIDEEITDKVDFLKFGRRAILNLRQILASKISDLQRESFCAHYSKQIGKLVS
ncbi:MAG: transcription termination/antitermination protein NusA, partial [Paludibacteraceae bacterium]|nr:transcription termination/antitermination protein NusA [Paludibacteraceae bacterium]